MAVAGIFNGSRNYEGENAIVLTRSAPINLGHIHSRSPLLLTRHQVRHWLGEKNFSHVSEQAVEEFDENSLEFHQVDAEVNSIKNDQPQLIDKS